MSGRAPGCKSCPGQQICLKEGSDPANLDAQKELQCRMGAIRHKIIVLSGKGGVGKSTVACGIAQMLALQGSKVGLLDVDVCGPSAARMMNIRDQQVSASAWGWRPLVSPHGQVKVMTVDSLLPQGDSPIVFRGPRKTNLIRRLVKDVLWSKLDYLIIDTPPGTSDEHLTIVKILQQCKLSGAVLVSTPQRASTLAVEREISFCRKLGLPILGIVENMSDFVCPCCNTVTQLFPNRIDGMLTRHSLRLLGRLPILHALVRSSDEGSLLISACEEIFKNLVDAVKTSLKSVK